MKMFTPAIIIVAPRKYKNYNERPMRLTQPTEALEVGQRYMMPSGRTVTIYKLYNNYNNVQEVTLKYEQTQVKGQKELVDFSEYNVRNICYRLAQK